MRRIGRCRLAVAVAALGIWVAHVSPAAAGVCVPLFHPVARSAQPLMDPEWLALGDFTGDGQSDLAFSRVVAFEQPRTTAIGVLAGHGSGIFGPPVAELIRIPGFNEPVFAGELTGDGLMDLATAGEGTGLLVLAGNGSGGFTPPTAAASAGVARVLAVVDVNRDGHADVIAAGPVTDAGVDLRVLLADRFGSFVAQRPIHVRSDAGSIAAGDVNGDGSTDLVLGTLYGNLPGILVLLGNGTGRFTALRSPVAWREGARTGDLSQIALADFSRDGRLDLVTRRGNRPQLLLALGDGTGRFRQYHKGWSTPFDTFADSLAVGRFNSDQVPDVALGAWTYDATGRPTWISILQGDGSGGWREAPGSPYQDRVGIAKLVAEDFDGNGFDDLAGVDAPTASSGTLHVLMNAGGRVFPGDRIPIREMAPAVRTRFARTDGDLPINTLADVIYGERVVFRAYLTCEPSALPGRRLALYRRLALPTRGHGRWKRVAERTTGDRGRVAAISSPPSNAEYQWRPADHRHPPMRRGPVLALMIAPRITVRAGRIVTGRVHPLRPGARIQFYASDGAGGDVEVWTRVGSAIVRRSGAFRHRSLRGARGGYIAVLAGNARYADGVSRRFG